METSIKRAMSLFLYFNVLPLLPRVVYRRLEISFIRLGKDEGAQGAEHRAPEDVEGVMDPHVDPRVRHTYGDGEEHRRIPRVPRAQEDAGGEDVDGVVRGEGVGPPAAHEEPHVLEGVTGPGPHEDVLQSRPEQVANQHHHDNEDEPPYVPSPALQEYEYDAEKDYEDEIALLRYKGHEDVEKGRGKTPVYDVEKSRVQFQDSFHCLNAGGNLSEERFPPDTFPKTFSWPL